MISTQSLAWLTAFLATVSALPVEEKRAVGDSVTATIDGQVVSWINNWSGVPTTAPASAASTTEAVTWVTATIDGQVVSWVNNWYGASTPAPTSEAAAVPAAPTSEAPAAPAATAAETTTAAAAPTSTPNSDPSCKDVHIFLSKGWNEPYPGRQGKLAGAICSGIGSCDYEDILFYNVNGSDYCTSVTEGDNNGVAQMSAYAQRCPSSKLVLTGYSQGANVAGDILGGSDGECTSGFTGGLDPSTSPGSKIAAALVFGDTNHVANQPYNVLSGAGDSAASPRSGASLERMNKFSNVLRSYCDHADPICAAAGSGPTDINAHLNYFDLYTDDAAGWVKSKLGY